MNEFEKALHAQCREDPQYDVLWAQWTYDKRLVTQALQAVGVLFPHYSLHDASHSNTILRQLARVLGPSRIKRLSPTDLWLLLEAAYHHDIGMVVPDAQKRQWWREPTFRVHLERLKESSDRDLRNAADLLSARKLDSLGDDWPFEVQHALLLAVADYARQQHPRMAEQIILEPTLVGLASPRTLIPKRAFHLLALICRHHGSTFEKALELPARESGYGTDEAHPRFVACMLRLGDLLDLDDGRFCPVLMKTLKGLPPSSLAHEHKHASIRHLLVSPTRIEVEAVCAKNDITAFDETERWLSWLRDELRNQAARWTDIAPAEDFGALPSAGRITARIEGHVTLDDGSLPRFEVDREAMINMVRGANIYGHPVSFLRELLQNAVDATLLRCWNEHRQEILGWEDNQDTRDLVLDLLRKKLEAYPIRVWILPVGPEPTHADALAGNKCRLKISIEDQGMGISRGDIRHMQSIGGSRRNQRKQQRRLGMPEWLQPSGIFGIGLQSVFLFTDQLEITTRPDDAPECLKITLYRGEIGSAGQIVVQELGDSALRGRAGTKLECQIEVPLMPERGRIYAHDEVAREFFAEFDSVKGTTSPYELALAQREISEFSRESLCPIELNGVALKADAVPTSPPTPTNDWRRYFDRKTNIEIKIFSNLRQKSFFGPETTIFYRGVHVNQASLMIDDIVEIDADLHFGRADELLTLSREQLRHDKRVPVEKAIREAILRIFPRYYENLRSSKDTPSPSPELQAASLFAEIEGESCVPPQKSHGEWRSVELVNGVSLGEIVAAKVIEHVIVSGDGESSTETIVERIEPRSTGEEPLLRITSGMTHMPSWLWSLLFRTHKQVFIEDVEDKGTSGSDANKEDYTFANSIYRFYLSPTPPLAPLAGDQSIRSILRQLVQQDFSRRGFRHTMPSAPGFDLLQIAENPLWSTNLESSLSPRMICPFSRIKGTIQIPNLVDVVNWTIQHTNNTDVRALNEKTPARARLLVAEAFLKFIEHAHQLMNEEWGDKRAYELAEIKFELRKAFGPLESKNKNTPS